MNIEDRARRAFWGGDCGPWEQLAEHIKRKWRLVVATVHKDIEEVGAMMVARWQPASSPPKDDRDVLLLTTDGYRMTGQYCHWVPGWDAQDNRWKGSTTIAAWHELPAPPPKLTEVERLTKERDEARMAATDVWIRHGDPGDGEMAERMGSLFESWKAKP